MPWSGRRGGGMGKLARRSDRRGQKPRNAKGTRVRRDGFDGEFVPGQQFSVDMRIRRQAAEVLEAKVTAARWPLVLEAIEAAAWPVETYLGKFLKGGYDVIRFRSDPADVGEMLHRLSRMTKLPVEAVAREPHKHLPFWLDDEPESHDVGLQPFRWFQMLYYSHFLLRASTADRYAYYATPEMSALIEAGQSADRDHDVAVTVADLPSSRGVLYLAPADGVPDHGRVLVWNETGRDSGSGTDVLLIAMLTVPALRWWLARADGALPTDGNRLYRVVNDYLPVFPFAEVQLSPAESDAAPSAPNRSGGAGFTDVGPDEPAHSVTAMNDLDYVARTFFSMVNMLRGNKFVESTRQQSARMRDNDGVVKRMREVTYLSYRQPRSASSASSSEGSGKLSHRHVVRGHWRRHWYPSQKRHLPMWIDEHLQGPADAPIVVKSKVTVVRPPAENESVE
uniref:Uncharacterized protein n=3 Tax=Mycobacteriales TaxID=85007 RepID=G8JYY9_RHOFA|nr:hypothetical protein pFi_124 [Rhodococcus fascians D188]